MAEKQNRFRQIYSVTLEPLVAEASKKRAAIFGCSFSSWVNHVLKKTEGMADENDMPEKDANEKEN